MFLKTVDRAGWEENVRGSQYIMLLIVVIIILVTLWERTQSIELFLAALLMLCAGIYAIHRRTQRRT